MNEELAPAVGDTAGAEDRFWDLYASSLPYVYGYLVRRCDRQTAEDLTQEVYTDLVRRVGRGDDPGTFNTGWLISVARSRLIDHMRAAQRRERKLTLAWSNSEADASRGIVRGESASVELGVATEQALAGLAEVERWVLVLHHLDGLSVVEIADSIGRSPRATESLLARARRKFRIAYQEAAHD